MIWEHHKTDDVHETTDGDGTKDCDANYHCERHVLGSVALDSEVAIHLLISFEFDEGHH
jgi:hypothetical protein